MSRSIDSKTTKIIAIMGHPFLEWNLAATAFLATPSLHPKFLSPNPATFKIPGVEYVFDKVSSASFPFVTCACASTRTRATHPPHPPLPPTLAPTQVIEIDPATKTITLEKGAPVKGWTALVVATGFKVSG